MPKVHLKLVLWVRDSGLLQGFCRGSFKGSFKGSYTGADLEGCYGGTKLPSSLQYSLPFLRYFAAFPHRICHKLKGNSNLHAHTVQA